MPTERIIINGRSVLTLRELLRPGLRAVFVGINPSPTSIQCGHYYQGTHGKRFWRRLQDHGLAVDLPAGREDDEAFAQGFGFADVVRRPTPSAAELSRQEICDGVPVLVDRLSALGEARPLVVFVYKKAELAAAGALHEAGFRTYRMPGPYAATGDARLAMLALTKVLARAS